MTKISVIIPFRDDLTPLRTCLDAVENQTFSPADFEVIAVNNGKYGAEIGLASKYRNVKWIFEPRAGSYSARNAGIEQSVGEFIAFTDADCVPEREWLARAYEAATQSGVDIVGGRIVALQPAGCDLNTCELFEEEFFFLFDHRRLIERFRVGVTANLLTRRKVFINIGIFDDRLLSGGDADWTGRAVAAGFALVYAPGMIVHHPRRNSFAQICAKAKRLVGGTCEILKRRQRLWRNMALYLYSHSPVSPAVHRSALFPRRVKPKDWMARVRFMLLVEIIAVIVSVEKIRLICGGAARRE